MLFDHLVVIFGVDVASIFGPKNDEKSCPKIAQKKDPFWGLFGSTCQTSGSEDTGVNGLAREEIFTSWHHLAA